MAILVKPIQRHPLQHRGGDERSSDNPKHQGSEPQFPARRSFQGRPATRYLRMGGQVGRRTQHGGRGFGLRQGFGQFAGW